MCDNMNKCPVCLSGSLDPLFRRKNVPVLQNLICPTEKVAKGVKRGDLTLAVCRECGFIFNQAFKAQLALYGRGYDNRQTSSGVFRSYSDGLIKYLVEECKVENKTIVEVGCGNGEFLRKICIAGKNRGIGIDPAYDGPIHPLGGRLRFERRYFGSREEELAADVVILRHFVEHTPDILLLLQQVREILQESHEGFVFVETPCAEWIMRNKVVWDFFYEHCSYFSADSLTTALGNSEYNPTRIQHAFNGQYLTVIA